MIQNKLIEFLSSWPADREAAVTELSENRLFNKNLKIAQQNGLRLLENKKYFSLYQLNSAQLISRTIPDILEEDANIPEARYLIQGSIGQGNPAEIPWVCVFDREITESAQDGYYIVFLFVSDMSGLYLSLNQGWTQYSNKYGVPNGKIEIRRNASIAKKLLKSVEGFSFEDIHLNANSTLGKGYELGNICHKYYALNMIPEDTEIINDLRNLIGIYRELKGHVGSDILEIQNNLEEDDFQEKIQEGRRRILNDGPIAKNNRIQANGSSIWGRDPNISFMALDNANFHCQNDNTHRTFISARTGHQFVEAHHLIPMEYQDEFDFSIDIPENIISLCPNCHRAFHNSQDEIKFSLIEKFHRLRVQLLATRSIYITEERLKVFYAIDQ
jgi:5-methylcytosine-specific restriction protein A